MSQELPVFVFGHNNTDFVAAAYHDLRAEDGVFLVDGQLPDRPMLRRAHFGRKLNRFGSLPSKGIWANVDWRAAGVPKEERSIILLVECPESRSPDYVRRIRRLYPHALLCTYLLNTSNLKALRQLMPELIDVYDVILTCSEEEAKKYGIVHWTNCYSRIEGFDAVPIDRDLSFIGIEKGRYDYAWEVYEKATSAGLTCDFVIQGAQGDRPSGDGFEWITQLLSYEDCLRRTLRAKHLLEIVDGGLNYSTYRTMEALVYGRHLITANKNVEQEPYFSKRQLHVATNADEVIEVVQSDLPMVEPDAAAIEYFSPRRLVEYLRECAK